MIEPLHRICHCTGNVSFRQGGAVDQYDRQIKRPRRIQLGPRAHAACIFRHDMRDAMGLNQGEIILKGKRSARDDRYGIGHWQAVRRRINQAQQIMMLWPFGKGGQQLLADRQKHAGGRIWQGGGGGRHIRNRLPVITGFGPPWRAFQGDERDMGKGAGINRIAAHLRGKGMGGIDHMADLFSDQIIGQARNAAKAAHPQLQGLGNGRGGAAGIGKHSINARFGKGAGHLAGFGRAAQQKDADHG